MTAASLSASERARLEGLRPPELAAALAVYTGDDVPSPDVPAIAGTHALDAEGLRFRPAFPLVPGLRYTARLDLGEGPPLLRRFEVPAASTPPPRVTATFPSGDTLPENTLRLYVHFSQPMNARDAHRHIRLLEEGGAEVPLAFVEVEHGLWDPRRMRLTLLFHPGRIKRGVAPGERLGSPLRGGHRYRLVVDGAFQDEAGTLLGTAFERSFQATPADRESPKADGLRVHLPLGSDAPLMVQLPEPLDEALLHRLLWVEDAGGQPVAGTEAVSEGETRWTFRPRHAWSKGPHAVRVHPALEDRAGNRFDRVFDREGGTASEPEPAAPAREAMSLPFSLPAW